MNKLLAFSLIALQTAISLNFLGNPGAEQDYKRYYFPVEKFWSPKVYKYTCKDNGIPKNSFWLLKTIVQNGRTYFMVEVYDDRKVKLESRKMEINNTGVYLVEYNNYIINKNEVFKWSGRELEHFKTSYTQTGQTAKYFSTNIVQDRFHTGVSEYKKFQGQSYHALEYIDLFNVYYHDKRTNTNDILTYSQINYFGEGLGIIEYKNVLRGKNTATYKLNQIMDMNEWYGLAANY